MKLKLKPYGGNYRILDKYIELYKLDTSHFLGQGWNVNNSPADIKPIEKAVPELCLNLSPNGSQDAAEAIMTTDTAAKSIAVEFEIGGKLCKIGCIAKGSGMIHPNMATMLVFITTDAAITPALLQKALSDLYGPVELLRRGNLRVMVKGERELESDGANLPL